MSTNAWMNAATASGWIALPAPRSMPTRPGSPSARGKSAGSSGIRRDFPSRHLMIRVPDARWISAASFCSTPSPSDPSRGPAEPSALPSPLAALPHRGRGPMRSAPGRSDSTRARPWPSEWATHHSRCRMCGAPMLAAHRSAAPTAYPSVSRLPRTPASQSRPRLLATCSPNATAGRQRKMRCRIHGQRCLLSFAPFCLPADEKGWQGQLPVQTGLSSGHPARRRARDHPPMPAKRWIWM